MKVRLDQTRAAWPTFPEIGRIVHACTEANTEAKVFLPRRKGPDTPYLVDDCL
jgi:hypothetical protein